MVNKNHVGTGGDSRFAILRLAIRGGDPEVISKIKAFEAEERGGLMALRRLFRENGATVEQVENYTRVEAMLQSAAVWLKEKNFIMATMHLKDAYIIEPDPNLKKKWLGQLINAYFKAINTYTKGERPDQSAFFAERLSELLRTIADNGKLYTSDTFA